MLLNFQTKQAVHIAFSNFKPLNRADLRYHGITKSNGWVFDWHKPFSEGFDVYGLFINSRVEGVIALKPFKAPTDKFVKVALLTTAPHNRDGNQAQVLKGVGKHLIAFACKYSIVSGCDGVVQIIPKTNKIPFYEKLGAFNIGGVMIILEQAANNLISSCDI